MESWAGDLHLFTPGHKFQRWALQGHHLRDLKEELLTQASLQAFLQSPLLHMRSNATK